MHRAAIILLLVSARVALCSSDMPPNVLLFIVDDLGWNQVGYHANPNGNNEIKTPNIDRYATTGIELNRGYMTPWCGPSRATIQTGRTNAYNENVSSNLYSFDEDIGFYYGLPVGSSTIATALKEYGKQIGKPYSTYFSGKWGIGGTTWTNTPMGMGYDEFRGFWLNGIDACDGLVPLWGVPPYRQSPIVLLDKNFGGQIQTVLPGYWEQSPFFPDTPWCGYVSQLSDEFLSVNEKFLACKTRPRMPPKHIDLDLLDNVLHQIQTHNYDKGPWLHTFATASMHTPMSYPKEYNEMYKDELPEYFQDGHEKPIPQNDDLRNATNIHVRFLDDLFEWTMQAIKQAGQWNNTIVYFTSDNGGAMYAGAAQNNYPLRSSKMSNFEGGVRVPQFIAGGWIDNHLSLRGLRKSNTYVFPNDIAPTVLEMAGADRSYLLQNKTGAVYGNSMWQYIKNSVEGAKPTQLVRSVSYGSRLFFNVEENRTLKFFFNGDEPQWIPRLWKPIFPTNNDLLPEISYRSVKPCRPNGVGLDCCYFDIEADWQEWSPMPADCASMHRQAQELYVIEGGCPKDAQGRNLNPICLAPGELNDKIDPVKLTIWTHYRAAGPFTNSRGQPVGLDLPMKCLCDFLANGTQPKDVDYYTPNFMTPSTCYSSKNVLPAVQDKLLKVYCNGAFVFTPMGGKMEIYKAAGFDVELMSKVEVLEEARATPLNGLATHQHYFAYLTRQGFTEWPDMGKFPTNFRGRDTCLDKGITPTPFPQLAWTPYFLSTGDVRLPWSAANPLGLCVAVSPRYFFCPSHQNALLTPITRWDFGSGVSGPYAVFNNGTKWRPMSLLECKIKCQVHEQGTAYIGRGGVYGLVA